MRVIDVEASPVMQATLSSRRGPPPGLPWRRPDLSEPGTTVVHWRGRQISLSSELDLLMVLKPGAVAYDSPSDSYVLESWDGRGRRIQPRNAVWDSAMTLADGRIWGVVRGPDEHDRLMWWNVDGSDTGVHRTDFGPRPRKRGAWYFRLGVQETLGPDDVVYGAYWQGLNRSAGRGFRRTSGLPADWDLQNVESVSSAAQLVAGPPRQTGRRPGCVAVYEAAGSSPLWTRCFNRGGRPEEHRVIDFTPDGSRVVVLVRGGRPVFRNSIFKEGDDTLLTLDAVTGEVVSRLDHNFGSWYFGDPEIEDDHHILFVHNDASDGPDRLGLPEWPYTSWIMRCSLSGSCELATGPIPADEHKLPVQVSPVGHS
jgi:hypothetical protein